jgi:hypothetical protein
MQPLRKDKNNIYLESIVNIIEQNTGQSLHELKELYPEDQLFQLGLQYVTTTKKAYCTALHIPVEAGCRYKRRLEKDGLLVSSIFQVICPFTKHAAHLITTDPMEFDRLLKSNLKQLNLFE